MEISQLIQFKTIAECNNMTEAAKKLHVSQPTLSIMLKKLEEELCVELFDRGSNRIQLNQAGEIAYEQVSLILSQIEHFQLVMKEYVEKHSTLTIGFCDPGPKWYIIPKYSQSFQEIKLTDKIFEETDVDTQYLFYEIYDIMITSYPIHHKDITSTHLIKDVVMLSVPMDHPLSSRKSISLKDESLTSIYMLDTGGAFVKKQMEFWETMKSKIHLNIYEDYFIYKQIIRDTKEITLSTLISSSYSEKQENRVLIPVTDKELTIDYYINYLSAKSNKVALLLEYLKEDKLFKKSF